MVKVAVSQVDGERYMLGENDSMEELKAKDIFAKQKSDERDGLYDAWLAKAKKAKPHDKRDAVILADALRHLEAARKFKAPVADGSSSFDSRWSPWADAYYEEAKKFTTCRDVLRFAQQKIPFDHRLNVEGHKAEFDIFEKLLFEEFPFRFDTQCELYDNEKSIPDTLYRMHARTVSNVFYWHLRIMFRCQEDVTPLTSITEIGGGYGSLARLWMLNKSADIKRYAIIDLPELLFYSEVCLRAELGDVVGYWEGKDPGTRIVLVPVGRIAEYTVKNDLVINVGSMQEMSDSWVAFYMDWLDKCGAKFFYSLNYMGQSISTMWESRTFWAPRMSRLWATRVLNADVPLVKLMCSGRDFAETLYERAPIQQKFSDWSVLKGCFFNRATYLEGLELLRQDFTLDNAMTLLAFATQNNDRKRLICPKEIFFISEMLAKKTGDPRLMGLAEALGSMDKVGTY